MPPIAAHAGQAQHVVAIDGRAAIREQIGGVERFAREISLRLVAMRPGRYRVIRPPRVLAHGAGHVWEQFALPAHAVGAALIVCPANLAPVLSSRNVVVIHDAAALRHPEAYSRAYAAYQRWILPLIARRARLVITVSEFSRGELVELLDLAEDRVAVIPEGVDERFAPGLDASTVREHFGLNGPYVLAVGTASARKNLGVLGAAQRALAGRGIELVLAGSDRGYLRGEAPTIRRLGYVGERHLPALYAGARALAMPSAYEGFGLPCLEAMAAGVPVVAAARGALPETVGDAALLADPGDPAEFAAAVLAAACDDELSARLSAAGQRRAARFSWNRTAALIDERIAELLEQPCVDPPDETTR